jgi:tRNA (cmo5U34)-methyltransferase
MKAFDTAESEQYDTKIVRRVPGYELLHEVAAAALAALLPDRAHVLLVGVGTGSELLRLLAAQPTWEFTALDASVQMLERAKARVAKERPQASVKWVTAQLGDPAAQGVFGCFDGALSLLVSHFVPGEPAKHLYFRHIADNLKCDAPLIVADLFRCVDDPPVLETLQRCWLSQAGARPAEVDRTIKRMETDMHPVDEATLSKLARASGFSAPERLVQVLGYRSYLMRRLCRS